MFVTWKINKNIKIELSKFEEILSYLFEEKEEKENTNDFSW